MLFEVYEKNWKIWIWIPFVLLFLSAAYLGNNMLTKGEIMPKDIELSGGRLITVEVKNVDMNAIEKALPYASIKLVTGETTNLLVQVPYEINETMVLDDLGKAVNIVGEPNIKNVGPVIGQMFWNQVVLSIIFAFVLMSIVVFMLFRSFVPSFAVILSVITDITITTAIISITGVKLSLAVFGALLMLIGYSVDTDILLTTNLSKRREKDIPQRIKESIKTGLTMSATTIAALLSMYFISSSIILKEIANVLIIGIIVDMLATWITNMSILRWWIKRKER